VTSFWFVSISRKKEKKKTGEAVKSHLREEHNFRNTGSGENCF